MRRDRDDTGRAAVAASILGAELVRLRWAGTTKAERQEALAGIQSAGGKAAWAGMTKAERATEMRRRWRVRKAKAAKEKAAPPGRN